MTVRNAFDIEALRRVGQVVAETLEPKAIALAKPGRKPSHIGRAIGIIVATGAEWAEEAGDGWTPATEDGSRVAQYEHTLIVTDGEPIITTLLGP